jgi:hypothetical protein
VAASARSAAILIVQRAEGSRAGVADGVQRLGHRPRADGGVPVLHHHGVLAGAVAAARASVADLVPRGGLELQRDVLHHVRRVGAAPQPRDEAAAPADVAAVLPQPGERGEEGIGEAGKICRGDLVVGAGDHVQARDRAGGPEAGAAQGVDAQEADLGPRIGTRHSAQDAAWR